MREEEIVEALKTQNEEFRKLYQEHRDLDTLLLELDKKHYLSTDEEIERRKLQKEKLNRKDRMAEAIREFKKTSSQSLN